MINNIYLDKTPNKENHELLSVIHRGINKMRGVIKLKIGFVNEIKSMLDIQKIESGPVLVTPKNDFITTGKEIVAYLKGQISKYKKSMNDHDTHMAYVRDEGDDKTDNETGGGSAATRAALVMKERSAKFGSKLPTITERNESPVIQSSHSETTNKSSFDAYKQAVKSDVIPKKNALNITEEEAADQFERLALNVMFDKDGPD